MSDTLRGGVGDEAKSGIRTIFHKSTLGVRATSGARAILYNAD